MANYALDNEILIGSRTDPIYHFYTRNLVNDSSEGSFSLDTLGNELAIDVFSFEVRYNADAPTAYSPTDADVYLDTNGKIYIVRAGTGIGRTAEEFLTDIPYGTPVWWDTGAKRIAKGYFQEFKRTSKTTWRVTCMSGIGLLDDRDHDGDIYNGATFGTIYTEIVGDTFLTRHAANTSGAEVWNTRVYGWLPSAKARANLHRLLFAVGASMLPRKGASSVYDYELAFLGEAAQISVPPSRVSLSASVTAKVPATGVEVTEHGFSALSSGEVVTLFDNTQGDAGAANELKVKFSEPIQVDTLTPTGTLSVVSAGVNYAVVSGTGTLTGKKYTHSRSIVSVGDTSGNERQVKHVTDNCLVSSANSINVANRVLSYYSSAKTVKSRIILDDEAPGDNLILTDGFGDEITAYVSKMELLVTSVRGASCELISDYVPDNSGNNFTHRDLITADGGTWTATQDGFVKIVLVQPGTGGQGGWNGHDGAGHYPSGGTWGQEALDNELKYITREVPSEGATQKMYYWDVDRQEAQPGGAPGQPGASGKILVMIREVHTGEVLTFGIPEGGAGGDGQGDNAAPASGTAPGETTVSSSAGWEATTADGARSEVGYRDILAPGGGATYALPGENGIAGGYGGMSDTASLVNPLSGAAGHPGQTVGQWAGGKGGKGVVVDALRHLGILAEVNDTASGGSGGGAAYGANGGNGGNAIDDFEWIDEEERRYRWDIRSGKGGAGADALPPDQPAYGCGGIGGNGGGGGGNIGGAMVYFYDGISAGAEVHLGVRTVGTLMVPHPFGGGKGGKGSKGGKGGDGCAIVYS